MDSILAELTQGHLVRFMMNKNPDLDEGLLRKAIGFIAEAHRNQFRKSGMPYSEHPFEVAKILAELRMDTQTVLAGLLHDVVEDTEHSLDAIKNEFGAEVAFMVDAVTKISAAQENRNKLEQKVATYRKFLVSMAKDPRVIMIKIADRLHNMRTLHYMIPEKRKAIATETLELYAPLTHRFGLYRFKFELEDLCFKNLNPDKYKYIVDRLQQTRDQRESYIRSIIQPLNMKMALENLDCTIQGRPKHLYSIWTKMKSRDCDIDDLFDLFAIRIIVQTIPECYLALGYIHNLWTPMQSRFKDYIATPKPNLYQSLHTTVIGPEGKLVEVQIRTRDMDETAEKGFAAHWAYKLETQRNGQELAWLEQLAKAQGEISDSTEFLEFLRVDLKPQDTTVFTPKGDAIELPHGATVLDFAFAVHTDLGFHCVGARIDDQVLGIDRMVPPGTTIHVLRSNSQEPSPDWLQIVKTNRAKHAMRRWLRTSLSSQASVLGKEIWERELRLFKIHADLHPREKDVCAHFSVPSQEHFFETIGRGDLSLQALHDFLQPYAGDEYIRHQEKGLLSFLLRKGSPEQMPVSIGHNESLLIHFAPCCNPLPGDPVMGSLVPGKGIEVHHAECDKLKKSPEDRLIAVQWKEGEAKQFSARLDVEASYRPGLHDEILQALTNQRAVIEKASLINVKGNVRDRFTLKVYNLMQLDTLTRSLKLLSGVRKVTRL